MASAFETSSWDFILTEFAFQCIPLIEFFECASGRLEFLCGIPSE